MWFCSLSPTDAKLATCSDDGTVRIFDFIRCSEEFILRGNSRLTLVCMCCCGKAETKSIGTFDLKGGLRVMVDRSDGVRAFQWG